MIQNRVISSVTEIYVFGGGNFITQSKPTYFHNFFTRKMLTASENMDDYKEVTPKERAALELQDAAFTEPPKVFIDQWNTACGIWGRYNEETGYFELNTLTDITYEEALRIYEAGPLLGDAQNVYGFDNNQTGRIRTNLPAQRTSDVGYKHRTRVFYTGFSSSMNVVNLNPSNRECPVPIVSGGADAEGSALISHNTFNSRIYIGILDLQLVGKSPFDQQVGCDKCEQLYLKNVKTVCKLQSMKALRWDCFKYLIDNAINTAPNTIYVHKNVYAKMTADETNEAYTSLSDEEKTQWTSLIELAAAKNIQFATS